MADEQDKAAFELQSSPSHLLHRAQQAAVNASAAALAENGLTLRQFAVLAALASEEGQSQARLVDVTGIDRSTLAEMVRRMELSGHIKRVTSKEDARAKAVSLMAKGRKAFQAALPAVEAADAALLDMIRANRRTGFLESLTQIGAPAEAAPAQTPVEDKTAAEPVEPPAAAAETPKPAPKDKAKPKKSKANPAKAKADKPAKAEKPAKPAKSDKKSDKKKKKKKK